MKKSKNFIINIIFLCIFIFVCIFFRNFILNNIIKTFALALWFFLRIFILSIDHAVIWGVMIFIIAVVFIHLEIFIPDNKSYSYQSENFYIKKIELWISYFSSKAYDLYKKKNLKSELTRMMVNLYAARKRIQTDFHLFDSFKKKEIKIPENIYEFIYTEEAKKSSFNLFRLYNRISGREAGEYYLKLEECLLFLENFMEIKNDNKSN